MRIVVKIGSSLLSDGTAFNSAFVRQLAEQMCRLPHEFVIVTSGAIATGLKKLGMKQKPSDVSMQQVLAAVGQSSLMREYEEAFSNKRMVAQVLLTNYDFSDRMRYLNVQNTILTLMRKGIIPIINENDTVTVCDIKKIEFCDSDALAANVAVSAYADLLIILADVDGFYSKNPREAGAELVRLVKEITDKELVACSSNGIVTKGGMLSKLHAAKIATEAGIKTVIANGNAENALIKILNWEIGTTFLPRSRMSPKKHWIAFASEPKGKVFINPGAERAVVKEKGSLLPVGILAFEGEFNKGDVVEIVNEKGSIVGKGITNYFSKELVKIKGLNEDAVFTTLGYAYREAIPRANMALLNESETDSNDIMI